MSNPDARAVAERAVWLAAMVLAVMPTIASAYVRDPRFEPITRDQLVAAVRTTPSASGVNEVLIARASRWGVIAEAYHVYTAAWEQHRSEAYANLWRGYAAQSCFEALGVRRIERGTLPSGADLLRVAEECLKRAAQSVPENPRAVGFYGFFLFQYGNRQKDGVALLIHAVHLGGRDPLIRDLLGDALSNRYGVVYQPRQAETELCAASQLDPQYAQPHYLLWMLYRDLGRRADADREKLAFDGMSYAAWGVRAPDVGHPGGIVAP